MKTKGFSSIVNHSDSLTFYLKRGTYLLGVRITFYATARTRSGRYTWNRNGFTSILISKVILIRRYKM